MQHTATHCNALQHETATYRSPNIRRIIRRFESDTMQHNATYCNTLQRTATRNSNLQKSKYLLHRSHDNAIHCNTLQQTATHCNALQHDTATYRSPNICRIIHRFESDTTQHNATHCNTLQHTATHCNTLQHDTATYRSPNIRRIIHRFESAHKLQVLCFKIVCLHCILFFFLEYFRYACGSAHI